ncbi:centrosome-associated protein 350 isoform X3 [Anabas testudineus]|uniref:centrosome-associated protein 350 isoform X3 n=1 Tax=Anabas testudineus TaxID=64144 RepID=UPI000E45CE9C|nr:centrosome-associated protein 350 isoform X3 [Anabas testudineus]
MREMRSTRRTEVSLKTSAQQFSDHSISKELTTAWKDLAQSKAALRHIENRVEAAPGTGVFLDSVMGPPKKKSLGTVNSKDVQQANDSGRSSKRRSHSHQSPEKSSSRSPLRNTTQDSNVRRNNSVEFREPLASYREATPLSTQLEHSSLQSVPGLLDPSSPSSSDPLLSQLVYQRDTRDTQTDRDLDSTRSSALESTEVRYLNDQPALDTLRTVGSYSHPTGVKASAVEVDKVESTPKAQLGMDRQDSSPGVAQISMRRGESTPSSSPGSASQRLENLRRHQPDDKLEKLKERIRRQRQHLEEAAEREKLLGYLEQPIKAAVENNSDGISRMPTAKIRKVAAAPPAPIYKGFNSTETKIQTPDGKVWKEEDFHNLSREIYRDLSQQFAESTRSRAHQQREQRADRSKDRRPPKPVRKVHRATPASDLNAKPVISPASWREGQKLVKMVLGPVPKLHSEGDRPHPADRPSGRASRHRRGSDPRSASNRQSQNSTEKPTNRFQGQSKSHSTTTSTPTSAAQDKAPVGISTDLLSADIQGILDDLQLECKAAENEERSRQRCRGGGSGRRGRGGSASRTKTSVSTWRTSGETGSSTRGCRSASPTRLRPDTANMADAGHKKRHYDADTVREYIARQQEERKKRQAEEKKALREEAERRNQRLQELYRKQREVAKTVTLPSEASVAPVQKRLQETYNKLLLEEAQLGDTALQTQPTASSSQMRPIYQPSGESDKENKRLEAPQSPSSSDRSLNDQPPSPLSRTDLDGGVASWLHPDSRSPAVQPMTGPCSSAPVPYGDHLFSHLLRLETAVGTDDIRHSQQLTTAPSNRSRSKMSRIEALKATAASLSNRIESEARKLVGEGINYGTATSVDMDTILVPQANVDDAYWTGTAAMENNDVAFRIQTILSNAGHSSYNGTTLSGAGSLYTPKGQKQKNGTCLNLTDPPFTSNVTGSIVKSYTQERRKLVNGLEKVERMDKMALRREYDKEENQTDIHESSAGSISEGPILSEGSFSEDEVSPAHRSSNYVPSTAGCMEAVDSFSGQRPDYQRLSEFQKEAARCPTLSYPFAQQDNSKAAWEELNTGSPLSVINIFTKNLHGHIKVSGRNSERNSPSAHYLHSGNGPCDPEVYEDDFISLHSSTASGQMKRASNSPSVNSHFEELMRRSPYEKGSGGISSQQSSFQSSIHSPHLSSGSASGSSPLSKHFTRKRGTASDQSDATLVEEQRSSCSPPSEALSSDSRKKGSDKSSAHSQPKSIHSSDTIGESSGRSRQSLGLDSKTSRGARPKQASPSDSPEAGSPPRAESPREPVRSGFLGANNTGTTPRNGIAETKTIGELQYSPAVLQQRMAAELQYLESIEESVRQLDNMEKLMGVSMAQQESVSLAQMLKAKQQQHERDLYELKIKAEREALETQLQLEENRQRVARAHIELQENLAANHKETLGGLQEATTKMMSQQAEAAQYTVDAARHIKEMTELARSQIAGALVVPPVATDSSTLDSQEEQQSSRKQDEAESDNEVSRRMTRPEESPSSLTSLSHSDSVSFRTPNLSGPDSSSHHSPSRVTSDHRECVKKEAEEAKWRKGGADRRTEREVGSSSIDDEVPTAANDSLCSDSIPSVLDEKGDSTSVATEYSLKFDESMTEDEIEERSFRSLLPSEAHRRGTMEKKSRNHEESEDDGANHNTSLVSGAHNILKDASIAFSGGQDSFSQFTMDMVRQYMKDEEVRLQHQSSLLRLRQKALKEKARTELAWLEHQKKRLRDKGEDDKMPPIRKRQRGLLMKLQQEQAEIRRLQEANKAAMKERQLLLKQQEEIERMRNSTLRLKERLKIVGGEAPPETPIPETLVSKPAGPSMRHADDNRSPSPSLSISGSETSSIMQKLKKMHSHMDEKHCSPVHYFLSAFTAHHWASLSVCLPNLHPKFQLFIYNQLVRFLTKREQQLMQRRRHAEELLQWKQRLDQEEAEVRRIEKEALAVWDRQTPRDKDLDVSESQNKEKSDISLSHHRSSEPITDSEKVTPESSIHTEGLGSQQLGSPPLILPASVHETPLASTQSSPANYTQDITSASHSPSRHSPVFKGSHSPAASPSHGSSKMQIRSPTRTANQARIEPADFLMATQTEPISDQSDIESRIKALKEELRKRKFMAYQLKKEQKKRHKERLKAQEASLLKQLETYDNIIEKTKAELNKEPDSTAETMSQTKDYTSVADQSSIKPSAHRSEASRISERTCTGAFLDHNASPQHNRSRSTSVPEELSDEDLPTVTPTPICGSPVCPTSEALLRPPSDEAKVHITGSEDVHIVSDQGSDIQEDLEVQLSSQLEDQHSEHLFNLEDRLNSQENLSSFKHVSSSINEQHQYSSFEAKETSKAEDAIKPMTKSYSATVDFKTSPHPNNSSSFGHPSFSPIFETFSSKKEAPIKDTETSSPVADAYHDDFESSVDLSPREDHHSSESQISVSPNEEMRFPLEDSRKDSPVRTTPYDSQDEEIEEEMAEELSHHSGTSEPSHQSGRLLDLNKQTEDNHDNKSIHFSHSPPVSPLWTPVSPVIDEMPSFNIGDRVLVGGVQPGTLKFKGPTSFANGFWAGVELDKSEGSNNGTYDGVKYFACDECHGIFAPPDKIMHLPDKFETYTDTTEDEDSFFDDFSGKDGGKSKTDGDKSQEQANLKNEKKEKSHKDLGGKEMTDESHLNSQHHKESKPPVCNGNSGNIMLEFENVPTTLLISDMDTIGLEKPSQKVITTLVEREDSQHQVTSGDLTTVIRDKEERDTDLLDTFTDNLFNNFVRDTVKQFAEIKKAKEQKIEAANQINGDLLGDSVEDEWVSSVDQKDGLPFFLPAEKEELSSPELCNRPESPVLGASGQEELAKRLAELELSRELLDDLGDDQDWFDEDFGLSSRREQQRLKQKQREEEERLGGGGLGKSNTSAVTTMGGLSSSPGGEHQVKTPPRPELPPPLPPKLPEQPAMVVPHSATEVEKMVHAATQEIWESYSLGREGALPLGQLPNPKPSQEYLGKEASGQDQEAIHSYRKAVYDLTWEILQEIFAEDPNTGQPQWVKPQRVKSFFHRVKMPGDLTKIQEFITAEVLKLYGLAKDQNQKTDWQKMLKFGRKKRDRVDHILVQELHEEEAQWVNYDEDELFVKMQLADSIFDALLKDTADMLTLIYDKRAKRDDFS